MSDEEKEITVEQRKENLAQTFQHHKAILNIHGGNITTVNAPYTHSCGYSGCRKAGSISMSIRGEDNFFCDDHFRMV